MLPKYKSFRSDLENLKNKIASLKNELSESVNADKLNNDTKAYYDELVRKFDTLNESFDVLLAEPKAEEDKLNVNWNVVSHTLDNFRLYSMPLVNDGDAKEVKDMTNVFKKDDKARIIWSIGRRLGFLNADVCEMENNASLERLTEKVNAYGEMRTEYSRKLASFDEEINYNSYEDMLIDRNGYDEKMKKYGEEYFALTEGGYVERLNAEYQNFKSAKTAEKVQLYEERGVYSRRSHVIDSEELVKLDEEIRQNDARVKEEKIYEQNQKLKIEENNKKIEEFKASIKDVNAKLSDILNRRAEKGSKIDIDKRTIEKYRNQVPGKNDDAGMRIVIAQRQKFIANHDKQDELVSLKADIDAKVTELGFGKMSPDELRRCVTDGKTFEPYGDKLIAPDAQNRIALYKAMKGFIERYKEIYKPSEAMSKSIDENVIDPYDLNHLIDKSIKSLKDDAASMLEPDKKDPELKGADIEIVRFNLQSIETAYNEISEYRNTEVLNDEAETMFLDRERTYNEKIRELEDENAEILQDIDRNNYYTKKSGEFASRRAELLKEKEDCDNKTAEYDAKTAAIDKECAEQYVPIDELNIKYDRVKRNYESAKNGYERVCKVIDKYEDFASAHRDLLEENEKLNKALEINEKGEVGRDVFSGSREAMEEEIRRFYNTRNCGRKEKHDDSTEYKQMIGAIEDLLGEGEHRRYNDLNADEFREKLLAVNTASAEYIRLKNKEWSAYNLLPSTQRKARLEFAARLRDFSADGAAKLERQAEKVNRLNTFVKGRDINNIMKKDGEGTLIGMINKAVALRQKGAEPVVPAAKVEEKELEVQKTL